MAVQQLAKAETISPVESEHAPFVVRGQHHYPLCSSCSSPTCKTGKLQGLQVLMGWVNCEHKYLAKYSELLSKHGYSSLRTIQPTFTGFSVAEAPRRLWASNILNYLLERQKVQRR